MTFSTPCLKNIIEGCKAIITSHDREAALNRFNGQKEKKQPRIFSESSRVNLNNLIKRVKEEEKKGRRNNLAISVAALSAAAVFGIILTL